MTRRIIVGWIPPVNRYYNRPYYAFGGIKMTEYIEREAAIQALGDEPEIWCERDPAEIQERNDWYYYRDIIEAIPVADVTPVRHGHWIFEEDEKKSWCTKAICSACGNVVENNLGLSVDTRRQYFLEDNHCCRICGAFMDRKEDEDEVS